MARATTTNYSLKKALAGDPERTSGLAEHWGPLMDANLDAIDTAIHAAAANPAILATTADPGSLTDNSGGAAADGTIAIIRSDTTAHAAADAADAVKELSTKVNAILAALRTAGVIV
jgi:hypothetical protein